MGTSLSLPAYNVRLDIIRVTFKKHMTPIKVYKVLTAFEANGLSYAEGEKYELTEDVVATLPEGTVVEFDPASEATPPADAPVPPADEAVVPPAGDAEVPPAPETPAPAPAEEAKPWGGNHTVGRE